MRIRSAPGILATVVLTACAASPAPPAPKVLMIEDGGSVFGSIEVAPEAMDAEDLGISAASELVSAAGSGDLEEVLRLIEDGVDVDERNSRGTTALMASAYNGHQEVVNALLRAGANPDTRGMLSWPLASAVYENHLGIVEALLQAGAETEFTDNKGRTLLMIAAREGQLEVARLLVARGADIDAVSIEDPPRTALLQALMSGHVDIAELLLEAGASTEMPDGSDGSILDVARKAHADLSRFLERPGS